MKRLLIAFAALVVTGAGDLAASESTVSRETSPSGITYTLIQMPDADRVSIRMAWKTDWVYRDDTHPLAPQIGTQLLLAGGAEGYAPGEAGELFEDMQVGSQLSPMPDHIYGELHFPLAELDEAIAIANAHLRAPDLDDRWLARIRDGMVERITEGQRMPLDKAARALRWAVLGDQPLRRGLSLDEPGDLDGITRADVQAWQEETITGDPASVVLAGNLDREAAGAAIDALLEGTPEATATEPGSATGDFSPRRILLHRPDVRATQLLLAAPIPPVREGQDTEDLLILGALGQGDQSVLFQAVRNEMRASYQFGAGLAAYNRDMRILVMTGALEDARLAEAEEVVRGAYAEFRDAGIGDALEARRANLLTVLRQGQRLPQQVSSGALHGDVNEQDPTRVVRLVEEVEALTQADILERLAEAYPAAEDLIVVAVSPDPDSLPGACVISEPREAVDCP